MNAWQTLVLNRVPEGMGGQADECQVGGVGKCSADTALWNVNNLLAPRVLRSTKYLLAK